MFVRRLDELQKLVPYRATWDELAAGSVFCSWSWLSTWWRHYGQDDPARELFVLLLFEGADSEAPDRESQGPERLVAILPTYLEESGSRGRILRLLGDGEVGSDYLDLLVDDENTAQAAESVADYLCRSHREWDLLKTDTTVGRTEPLAALVSALRARGCVFYQEPDESCWSFELPDTWEELIEGHSRSHRKKLRRLERRMNEDDATAWHLVDSPSELETAWPILVDLHQRRRQSLGEPGLFASERWAAFHNEVVRLLLAEGHLRLSWLEVDGSPIAIEYNLASGSTTFGYQGGIDPDCLELAPGRSLMIRTVQRAIAEGHSRFDLLRGDYDYKLHWRAEPSRVYNWLIVAPNTSARLRYWVWRAKVVIRRLRREGIRVVARRGSERRSARRG